MTSLKAILLGMFLSSAIATGGAQAQMKMDGNKMGDMKMSQPTAKAASAMTEGEIRKIDKTKKEITLRHGEISNLGMSGMTMSFGVPNPKMLKNLKEGDKVKFTADKVKDAYVVTHIEKAK